VKTLLDSLRGRVHPALVLPHQRADLHQAHRRAAQLALNTFRNHLLLGFEIPKYDGDMGAPNAYMRLSAEVVDRKIELLERHFASQQDRHWYDQEVFRGLLRVRGMECNAPSGYAEGFYASKLVL
jgi:LmbE family N-acetylglucosaminyl deacetylase